jgi:hypothetical protein
MVDHRAFGYIIVLKLHCAPWATAEEKQQRIEVVRGSMNGYGPCIFWCEEQARDVLKQVKSSLLTAQGGGANTICYFKNDKSKSRDVLSEEDVDAMCEMRRITWS